MAENNRKAVYHIKEAKEGRKAFWTKIGVAFVNKDGSVKVFMDVLPIDGKLHIRDERKREDYQDKGDQQYQPPSGGGDMPF